MYVSLKDKAHIYIRIIRILSALRIYDWLKWKENFLFL